MRLGTYSLNLYTKCNLKCRFCESDDFIRNAESIRFNEIKKEILKVKKIGYENICFGGSEPTLYPRLFEAIIYAKRLGFKASIFTNGIILSSITYIKKLIPLRPFGIRTTFHSHREEVFDYLTGVRGSFIKVTKALENIYSYLSNAPSRANGLLVHVVINQYNYKDLPEIMEFLYRYKVKLVKLSLFRLIGSAYRNPDLLVDLEKIEPYFFKAVHLMKNLGMHYDFDGIPICFMETERVHFNTMYGAGRGIKLKYCSRCRHNDKCSGIPKIQIIARYEKELLKSRNLFPKKLFEQLFSEKDLSFIKKI